MLADRLRSGFPIGLLGGAVTAGALMGLGLRHQSASLAFELGGRALLSTWRFGSPPVALSLAVGGVAHFFWMTLWGFCFSIAATRLRGTSLAAGALLFVLFLGALASTVVPGALGAVAFAALTSAQTAFFLALLAGAFIAGVVLTRDGR
ncbi:MAG: hypothetical protein ABI910_13635 [Gemmatimonadota bacterium]